MLPGLEFNSAIELCLSFPLQAQLDNQTSHGFQVRPFSSSYIWVTMFPSIQRLFTMWVRVLVLATSRPTWMGLGRGHPLSLVRNSFFQKPFRLTRYHAASVQPSKKRPHHGSILVPTIITLPFSTSGHLFTQLLPVLPCHHPAVCQAEAFAPGQLIAGEGGRGGSFRRSDAWTLLVMLLRPPQDDLMVEHPATSRRLAIHTMPDSSCIKATF